MRTSHLKKYNYKAYVQRLLETAEANAPLVQRSMPSLAADFYTRTELAQLQGHHVSHERLQTSQTSEKTGHQVPSSSGSTSPRLRNINRYQMEKQAFGLGRKVVQTSHDQLEKLGLSGISTDQESPIYTAFPDAPPDTRQGLNPALDLPASFSLKNLVQNPMSFNGYIQHPNFSPKLISAFNLQNPDSFAAGYVDVNQRLDAIPRLAPPRYSLFRNSHPTDCGPFNGIQEEVPADYSLSLRKSLADPEEVLKELENNEDHGNIPNPIDIERYYDWLSEALHGNN